MQVFVDYALAIFLSVAAIVSFGYILSVYEKAHENILENETLFGCLCVGLFCAATSYFTWQILYPNADQRYGMALILLICIGVGSLLCSVLIGRKIEKDKAIEVASDRKTAAVYSRNNKLTIVKNNYNKQKYTVITRRVQQSRKVTNKYYKSYVETAVHSGEGPSLYPIVVFEYFGTQKHGLAHFHEVIVKLAAKDIIYSDTPIRWGNKLMSRKYKVVHRERWIDASIEEGIVPLLIVVKA